MFPALAKRLNALLPRIVDLLPITRDHYYHPAMKGSFSIKNVLPTVAPELDYANLEGVQDGGMAQEAYLAGCSITTSTPRHAEIATTLRRYCAHDTNALRHVFDHFQSE